ncbi:MAG: hypothetical protein OHK0029_38150 [Armatimonadaceae bacterium]
MESSEKTPPDKSPPDPAPEKTPSVPRKIDPWEQRERERERWQRRSGSAPSNEDWTAGGLHLRENYLLWGLLASLSILFFSDIPLFTDSIRTFFLQVGTGLVVLLLATCRGFQEDMRGALRRGPNPFLLGLLAWTVLCLFLSPYKDFAGGEVLRIIAGVSAYFITAYVVQAPRQSGAMTVGLLLLGVVAALWDLSSVGQRGGIERSLSTDYSVLGTHETVGSLLVLFLPVALAFAFHTGIEEKRRLVAMAAALILGGTLIVARTRSAWLGGIFAVAVLSVLLYRFGPRETGDGKSRKPAWQRLLGSPITVVAIGFVLFIAIAGIGPALLQRASLSTIMEDGSLATRIAMWNGAALMVAEKPWTGWGLGSYLVMQGTWTHLGYEYVSVLKDGVGHENIAHNYYVQWAADAGLPGLLLHIAPIAAFLFMAPGALKRAADPSVQALLMGVTAMVCGSLVDAIASPAYNYPGVSTLFWVWIGLAVGMMRVQGKRSAPEASFSPTLPPVAYAGALAAGVVVAGGVWLWGTLYQRYGESKPRGTLEVKADPSGPVLRGTTIQWTAVFTNAEGVQENTMPGTRWELITDQAVLGQAQATLAEEGKSSPKDIGAGRLSAFRVLIPPGETPVRQVTAKATYMDRYGRRYTAWSMKTVR